MECYNLEDLKKLINQEKISQNFLVDNLIVHKTIVLLSGTDLTENSTLALQLAISVIAGKPFLTPDFKITERINHDRKVVYITNTNQNPLEIVALRLKTICSVLQLDPQTVVKNLYPIYIDELLFLRVFDSIVPSEKLMQILAASKQIQPALVVIDDIVSCSGADGSDLFEVNSICNHLLKFNTTVLLVYQLPECVDECQFGELPQNYFHEVARTCLSLNRNLLLIEKSDFSNLQGKTIFLKKQNHCFIALTEPKVVQKRGRGRPGRGGNNEEDLW